MCQKNSNASCYFHCLFSLLSLCPTGPNDERQSSVYLSRRRKRSFKFHQIIHRMESIDIDNVLYWNKTILNLNSKHFCLVKTKESNDRWQQEIIKKQQTKWNLKDVVPCNLTLKSYSEIAFIECMIVRMAWRSNKSLKRGNDN